MAASPSPLRRDRALAAGAALAAAALGAVVVVLSYATSPVLALALLAGAAGGAVVILRPVMGLCAGFAAVPLEGLAVGVGVAGLSPAEVVFVATAASALLHLLVGRAPLRAGAEHAWLAGLVAVGATGMAFAQDPVVVTKIALMWTVFLVLSVYVAGCTRRELHLVTASIVAAGAALGLMALAGAGDIRLREGGAAATNRATGAFNHPNLLAFFLELVLPLAVVLAIGLRGWRRPAAAVAALVILAALLLTLSRGAILAAVVAIAVLLVWQRFRRVAAGLLVVVAVFGAVNARTIFESEQVNVLSTRLQSIQRERETNPRLRIYARTPAMIADRPVLGVGLGNFPNWSPQYGMRDRGGEVFLHAHNVPLTIAAETGLLGLAALGGFVVALGRRMAAVLRQRQAPLFGLGVGLVAALAGMGVISLTDYGLRSNPVTAVLFVQVGLLVAVARRLRAGGDDGWSERPLEGDDGAAVQ